MHGREVRRCDLLLDWLCAMSDAITELDLLRLLNTGISSLAPVTGVQPSLCLPWLGRSLSAYLASRMPSTPTRYATYGLQVALTLCSEKSEIVLIRLRTTITDMPLVQPRYHECAGGHAGERDNGRGAEREQPLLLICPVQERARRRAWPRWHTVRRERAPWTSSPPRRRYTPTQKKAHRRVNNGESTLQQVCNSSAAQPGTKWREDCVNARVCCQRCCCCCWLQLSDLHIWPTERERPRASPHTPRSGVSGNSMIWWTLASPTTRSLGHGTVGWHMLSHNHCDPVRLSFFHESCPAHRHCQIVQASPSLMADVKVWGSL